MLNKWRLSFDFLHEEVRVLLGSQGGSLSEAGAAEAGLWLGYTGPEMKKQRSTRGAATGGADAQGLTASPAGLGQHEHGLCLS